ncbi:MAG: L-glutamate gamma-semialdehyde dehydrogenase [Bacillota bacterium]
MLLADPESRTREIGREIFAAAARDQPRIGSSQWLDDRFMSLSMRNEAAKVQLFRFIDVLPALKTSSQINHHLREYLTQAQAHLPVALQAAVRHIPDNGWVGGMLASAARSSAHRLARRFIAGSDLEQTLATLLDLRHRLLTFTIDLLGEAVLSEAEALQYQQAYLQYIDALATRVAAWPSIDQIDRDPLGPLPCVNVSIKLSSLFSQFDPIDPIATSHAVRDRLRPILRLARSRGVFVNIDMEQYAYKDLTLRIFQEILDEPEFRDWPDVGIAIQAYLRSSADDLQMLFQWTQCRGTPIWVRLVKGAYWDYETTIAAQNDWPSPVFTDKSETDANFEAQTAFLIEHHDWLRPAIASHNVRSIAHALALAEAHHLPPRSLEFQMLFGMADPLKAALVARGQRIRVYTPFGQLLPGMAYLVRRLLENTSNTSFLRVGFLEHIPMEQLLMNPLELIKQKVLHAPPNRPSPRGPVDRLSTPFQNEPLADFSLDANRSAMQSALVTVGGLLGATYPLAINAQRISTASSIDSINPSHPSQIVGHCASATAEDARHAIAVAKGAFPAWRDTPVQVRAGLLLRAADTLRRRRFELSAWEIYECGKQWREADADVAEAIDYCEYYAREMHRLSTPQHRDVPGEENACFYEPRGVAVIIAPWNFPLAILCGMTTAALVAGNPAIMKPAAQSPVIAAKLMEVFEEAGFPPGVVSYLPGVGAEIGPILTNHPDVSLIAFTGSRSVGLSLTRDAALVPLGQDHIKRVITELGGKNAIIIDEDADLDEAVRGVAASAFGYAGQKCSACSRVIILEPIYDTFLARLIEVTRSLRVGPAEDPAASIGPVIDARAHRRILEYIQTGKQESRLVYPDSLATDNWQRANPSDGYFIPPHIFAAVPPSATIAQEEIFGPVLAVLRAHDLTEALDIANGTSYALTGGLYSRSPDNIARVRREFRVGNLYINRKITGALVDRQPFGGFKLSGIGSKAGGPDYLLQFLWPRTVTENTLRRGFAPAALTPALTASPGLAP